MTPLPPPYLDRKKRDVPDLEKIWSFINPMMLYVRHLGFRGNFEKKLAERDPKALELKSQVDAVKNEAKKFMKVKALWQFFEAEAEGNSIHLFETGKTPSQTRVRDSGTWGSRGADPSSGALEAPEVRSEKPLHTFTFPRQKANGLCLSDYVLPSKEGVRDHIAVFVVTAGKGIMEQAQSWKEKGDYLKSHTLQALAIETAEGCAEWLHQRIREDWGFADPTDMTMLARFQARYRGKRYSPGYPACPDLEDQKGIFKLLRPEDIGVHLTEGMMMDPEASVSAFVFSHPQCQYFSTL